MDGCVNKASDFLAFLPLLTCLCHSECLNHKSFEDQLKTLPLLRSLPWSPPETITPSSTATPDLPLSSTVSLRIQDLGLCPLRTQFGASPVTQTHSAASLGQRGKLLAVFGKGQAGGVCLGYGCKCAF